MVKGISADTALSELPEGSMVWVVARRDSDDVVMVPNAPTGEPILLMFLKREDASHLALLLSKEAPGLKDQPLDIVEIKFHYVLGKAIEQNQPIALLGPHDAMTFFREFAESLPEYYN